jgi:hypothetical protein
MPRFRAIVAVALLVAALPRSVRAGPRPVPPVHLVYVRSAGAGACPDVDGLRRAVLKEMGYDPFADEAPAGAGVLRVTIERRTGQLEAAIEMRDAAGQVLWSVDGMRSRSDCRTLVEAVGLAIVIRIDPAPAPAPPPSCPGPPEIRATPARASPPAPAPAAPPVAPAVTHPQLPLFLFGGGPLVAVEAPPAIAPGLAVVVEVRGALVALGVEARAVLPGAGGRQGQRIDAWSFAGTIAPCARLEPFFACGLIEGGSVVLTGPSAPAPTRALALAGVGFRAGFERRLSRRLALRTHADLLGTLTHEQALLSSSFIWSAPEAVGVIGVELMIASRGLLSGGARVTSTSSTSEAAP